MPGGQASEHFTFRDFILDAGSTSGQAPNVPQADETYRSMERLAKGILEPLRASYGEITLTYGFCSPARAKLITRGTYQKGDQHVGHEVNRAGKPICERQGFAVDLKIADGWCMAEAGLTIVSELEFDRMYFYGQDRPVHVSVAPTTRKPSRAVVDMRTHPVTGPLYVTTPRTFFRKLVGK